MRPTILSIVVVVTLLLIVASVSGEYFFSVASNLVFGWLMFLKRVGHKLTVNWNAVLTAIVCLALIYTGLHTFLRWLTAAIQSQGQTPGGSLRTWRWRWTSAILGVLVLMFVAGLSFIAIAHQTLWLATAKQPHVEERADPGRLLPSKNQLFVIGWGVINYSDSQKAATPRGSQEAGKHSWMTMSMPFTGLIVENIDYKLDWNHPKNEHPFQRIVPFYLNPEIAPFRNAEGYALSHYAGNVHVLGNNNINDFSDVENGSSNTFLVGEVAADFKAWGDPTNLRDPSRGINKRPDGFGGPSGDGAVMVMLDGSIKFFSKETSSRVLTAISHPNAGTGQ